MYKCWNRSFVSCNVSKLSFSNDVVFLRRRASMVTGIRLFTIEAFSQWPFRSVPFLDIDKQGGWTGGRLGTARQWSRAMHTRLPRILTHVAAGDMAGDAEEGSTTYRVYGGSILSEQSPRSAAPQNDRERRVAAFVSPVCKCITLETLPPHPVRKYTDQV
jgi:hypothetical protein